MLWAMEDDVNIKETRIHRIHHIKNVHVFQAHAKRIPKAMSFVLFSKTQDAHIQCMNSLYNALIVWVEIGDLLLT